MGNIKDTTFSDYKLYFGVEPGDKETIAEALRLKQNVVINKYKPNYADALQSIYEETDEPIFFWANDDFKFLPDWDKAPMQVLADKPRISVLGVHDGNPATRFYTISFIRRKYIEEQSGVVDMPNRVLYPYGHNFVDDELSETAIAREVWGRCEAPCIEHQHPSFTWLGEFPADAVNQKNDSRFAEDVQTFHNRRHLWS